MAKLRESDTKSKKSTKLKTTSEQIKQTLSEQGFTLCSKLGDKNAFNFNIIDNYTVHISISQYTYPETILLFIKKNDKLLLLEGNGYSNGIKRFGSIKDLIADINTLKDFINSNPLISKINNNIINSVKTFKNTTFETEHSIFINDFNNSTENSVSAPQNSSINNYSDIDNFVTVTV